MDFIKKGGLSAPNASDEPPARDHDESGNRHHQEELKSQRWQKDEGRTYEAGDGEGDEPKQLPSR
jgi:hypothetical protein